MLVVHLAETKKELKSLCRQGKQILFIEISLKRTQSDKFSIDKAFKIASDPKYDGYQTGLASMVYKFFD